MASTATPSGKKRKHNGDGDDVDQQPAPKKTPRKVCIVCADDVPRNGFPKLPHKQDSEKPHNSDVCKKCCSERLRHEVKTKSHNAVGCPQCSKPLEQSEVQKLASSETYQEYVTGFQ
jgi:superfamily II helicase